VVVVVVVVVVGRRTKSDRSGFRPAQNFINTARFGMCRSAIESDGSIRRSSGRKSVHTSRHRSSVGCCLVGVRVRVSVGVGVGVGVGVRVRVRVRVRLGLG